MNTYIDNVIIPNPEIASVILLDALFGKLHRTLGLLGNGAVGVSFPRFDNAQPTLGPCLRLHGTAAALGVFEELEWLGAVRDHVRTTGLTPVPEVAGYRTVRRVQVKSNPARLRRRLIARHGMTETVALQAIPDTAARRSNLPFLTVKSASTAQTFRLLIQHGPLVSDPTQAAFSAYGLSTTATIPWF